MTERVSMINSNNTQLNSDYDYSRLLRHLLGDQDWVLFSDLSSKPEFDIDLGTWEIASWTAIILCTRTASQPIANQKFYALFQSDAAVTVDVSVWQKIFIEIDDTLVQDPTLIDDTPPSTSYARGLNIGQIKSETSYPSHGNYIKLWEIDAWPAATDMREEPWVVQDAISTVNALKIRSDSANQIIYIDSNWEAQVLAFGTNWKVLGISWGNIAFISPSIDIESLSTTSSAIDHSTDLMVLSQWWTNYKVTPDDLEIQNKLIAWSKFTLAEMLTEETTASTSYTKMKEAVSEWDGTISYEWEFKSNSWSYTAYVQVYINGSPVSWTEHTDSTWSYVSFSWTVDVSDWDLVQVYCKHSTGSFPMSIRNVYLKADVQFFPWLEWDVNDS